MNITKRTRKYTHFAGMLLTLLFLQSCNAGLKHTPKNPVAPPRDQITLGNGERSNIMAEGMTQDGATFTFKEVNIEGNGWLVLHPFKEGRPHGVVYVGSTYVKHGTNKNVSITVKDMPKPGENYLVMLHWDVDQDKNFDFGDGITVPDAPLFEGTKMIAFPVKAHQ
ncbi:MAG: hypothetical protein AB8G86_11460 [Saprospiraceae bacterium]